MNGTVHEFDGDGGACVCHGLTREQLGAPEFTSLRFWLPAVPEPEAPEAEVTPIPTRRVRSCYTCGARPAVARAVDEPAFCEEHRKKK